ncbi:MAG TPA: zf-HC2 domain-containing protein [Gemmataceae bacterium]|jgi:anti-sigma factor RsiW|nr:zf-HC2 domain-containing protein [Gemmataceae bacterium]
MITCRELAELLIDLVAGELPPEQQAPVDGHLNDCPSCLAFVESYRLTVVLARQLPDPEVPVPVDGRLRTAFQQYLNAQS